VKLKQEKLQTALKVKDVTIESLNNELNKVNSVVGNYERREAGLKEDLERIRGQREGERPRGAKRGAKRRVDWTGYWRAWSIILVRKVACCQLCHDF
jgi:hypothetical protein